jgi:hypothetical protein
MHLILNLHVSPMKLIKLIVSYNELLSGKSNRKTRRSSVVDILSKGGGEFLRRLGCTQSTQASQSHIFVLHVSISAFLHI